MSIKIGIWLFYTQKKYLSQIGEKTFENQSLIRNSLGFANDQ